MSSEAGVSWVLEWVDRYWDLAYAEGKEGRDHDTEAGDAQACRHEIETRIAALLAKSAAYDELVARVEGAPLADIAEDGKHNGTSSLLSAAIAAGYYNGQRVRLLLDAHPSDDAGDV